MKDGSINLRESSLGYPQFLRDILLSHAEMMEPGIRQHRIRLGNGVVSTFALQVLG